MNKLPISAIVIGFNESKKLGRCLDSIMFCDEVAYVDLGSNDDSLIIAAKYANKIFKYKLVPSGEYAQAFFVPKLKHDWILYIDPDEVLDFKLQDKIKMIFSSLNFDSSVASVSVPWKFYFKNIQLKGTPWGLEVGKPILANRNRFDFFPVTHYGRRNKPGFKTQYIKDDENGSLHHFWVESLFEFISKHARYLKKEGVDRFNLGHRTNFLKLVKIPVWQFYYAFISCKGYKNFILGFLLSCFWTLYQFVSELKLFLYQLKVKKN